MSACSEGNTHRRMSSKVGWNCVDVAQVHRQWVIRLFANGERNNGRRRREQHITLGVGTSEVITDESTNLECFAVVRVVITSRQCVGSEHDAALNFFAKASGTGCAVHRIGVSCIDAQAVTHSVIASQVATRFCWRDEVIRSKRVLHGRHFNINNCCSSSLQSIKGRFKSSSDIGVGATWHVGNSTNAQSFNTLRQHMLQ